MTANVCEAYSKLPSMTITVPDSDVPIRRSISGPCVLSSDPSTSPNVQSLSDEQQARDSYVVTQEGLVVFESCESWMMFRRLKVGDIVEAAGEVQDIQGFKMLPILPHGAVEMRGLSKQSEDMRRPVSLNRCLFGSSEDERCHLEDSSLSRPADEFVETDDEFSYEFSVVAVKHDDFTFRYVTTPPPVDSPCQQPCSPKTVESSSDEQSSTTREPEGKSEGEPEGKAEEKDATPRGAKMIQERLVFRNTFFDVERDSGEKVETEWKTCPAKIMTTEFRTKYPAMEQAHIRGDCRPCAYFLTKADGCQHGEECSFCHLCPVGALKKKKKEKVKSLKQRDYRARLYRARAWGAYSNY